MRTPFVVLLAVAAYFAGLWQSTWSLSSRSSVSAVSRPTSGSAPPPASQRTFSFGILTQRKNHKTRLTAILDTWGKHAALNVVSTDSNEDLPNNIALSKHNFNVFIAHQGQDHLGMKVMDTVSRMCQFSADYHVLTDDDTFVILHNLEAALQGHDPQREDLYTGYMLTHAKPAFIGGGGGIVLSNRTMKRVCDAQRNNKESVCSVGSTVASAGDVAVQRCLTSVGVAATHTDGFYPFPVTEMVKPNPNWCDTSVTWWAPAHIRCPPVAAAIAFHYTQPEAMREMYYWAYVFRRR